MFKLWKQLFSSFVERVDVFEDYVTIVLKVFDMINIRVCNGSGAIKEEHHLMKIKWCSGMVEPRGIEPLSESNLERTSPGAVCYLHSLIPAGTNTLRKSVAS